MNSLVSADYGSSSDSNDENTHLKTISTNNYVTNFLRSLSDAENDRKDNNDDDDGEENKDEDDDDDDDDSDSSVERSKSSSDTKKMVLPSASSILLNGNNKSGQVFNNPYKKAEIDQIACLEKHVKMVETDAHTHTKNGKKICWNYRKGRCRFGSNCTYAHDSDLHVAESTIETDNETHIQRAIAVKEPQETTAGTTTSKENIKKRPGLGDSIIPSKKVIKAYNTFKK